jgi:ATP-dependent DNA helicase PIF1
MKQQILQASIVNSYLWKKCTLMHLYENVRLNSRGLSDSDKAELRIFAEWLLRVGSGTEHSIHMENEPGNKYIKIPQSLLLPIENRNLDRLIFFVYSLRCEPKNPSSYFSDRTILAPTNNVVAAINNKMIQQLSSQEILYYSLDTIDDSTVNYSTMEALYPTKFLNSLSITDLPDHVLHLKVGVPVMLLRNLDPSRGLCNGTRLIVAQLTARVIEGEIIIEKAKGTKAYIPRIITTSVQTR